jgi:FkbM family methyltransferase
MNRVNAVLPDGTRFKFFVYSEADQFISARIQRRGSWEPFPTSIMLSLIRPGDVVVDIGANIGWYTVALALKVGETGRVFGFEPEPENADMLERNVALNELRNVRVFRCALADNTGTMDLVKSATNKGDHRLSTTSGSAEGTPITVETLDGLAARHGLNVDQARIVKVDTQGAEVHVLRGAHATLARLSDECAVFIEFSPNLLRRHDPEAPEVFLATVAALGRNLFLINSRFRTIHPVSLDELRRFAAVCGNASEDVGLDLILAPRDDSRLRRFCRIHAPFVKPKVLKTPRPAVRRATAAS